MGREGVQDAREVRVTRANDATRGAESCVVGDRHGGAWRTGCGAGDVRRAYFYAPARRRVFVELPPGGDQPGDEHKCGLLRYSLYGTRDAAQNWEEELATTLSSLKLTRGSACPCVWRGHIKGEHIVATVHGDGITIGGERSTVEFLIRMKTKKYEIKKQKFGEDPDLEKSGRFLNRVIEWNRDGITIEADHE